jgi:glycosyltransferase involved in cell wall biosynthesis
MSPAIPSPFHECTARCCVSVIIKAANDEKNIAAAIESSLAAVAEVGGEVIVVDNHSTDRTVEIASSYPVRIVQAVDPNERSRGVAPQLGYQHSCGDYLYLLDGDMQMVPGFLFKALAFMAQHPEAGGVGGRLVELQREGGDQRERALRQSIRMPSGEVDRLHGGGLYRRRAIVESGYFSDRNLHSYEEFDVAVRLRALGWKLWRIPVDVATHCGEEPPPPYRLLAQRWRSGYLAGLGELLRANAGQRRLRLVLRGARELQIHLGVIVWWCALLSVPFWPLTALGLMSCFAALVAAPWLLVLWRKRSPGRAWYTLLSTCISTAGLVRGLLRPQRPPRDFIDSRVLQEPPQASASRREHYA